MDMSKLNQFSLFNYQRSDVGKYPCVDDFDLSKLGK